MPDNLYRRGKIWWGRIHAGGSEHRRSLRTADRTEARKRLQEWREQIKHAAFYGEARHTYLAAVIRWNAEWLPGNVAPRTADRYRLSLKALDPHFNALFVDQITPKEIAKWVSRRKRDGVTNATVRRDLTALSTILKCCCAWGWRDDNPAKAFDRDIIRERREPILLPTDGAILAAVLNASQMMGRLLLTLFQTGMRLEEAASLQWRQVDVRAHRVAIEKTKGRRSRAIQISDALAGTFSGTPPKLPAKWVFWHGEGGRYVNLSTNLAKTIKAALPPEVPRFRVHDLRHRFAVDWLRKGGDIYELSKHLGHTSVKTTEIYLEYLARNPAQEHRFDRQWPFAKPLAELTYQDILAYRPMAAAAVL